MPQGHFIDFNLPYMNDKGYVSSAEQATAILEKAKTLIGTGIQGVAITYSANYGQTRTIEKVYADGGWDTQTDGANQAAVMHEMEQLMAGTYSDLQGKMRIAPITTMNAYTDPVTPWDDNVLLKLVKVDLARIQTYLNDGWDILGWQNQDTVKNPKHPFAVGGGVAALPPIVSDEIQKTLMAYSEAYKP